MEAGRGRPTWPATSMSPGMAMIGRAAAKPTRAPGVAARPIKARSFSPKAPPTPHPTEPAAASARAALLAWTEETGWQRGGSLAWQLFDRDGKPLAQKGRLAGAVPVWGLATAVARPDGGFTIVY